MPVTVEKESALQEAFDRFSRQTSALREAYRRLKEEAARVNVELERTNRRLEQKVRELDETNNFLHSILLSIPTAVLVTDLEGSVTALNPAAEDMWGISDRDAIGRSYGDILGRHGELLESVLLGRSRTESLRRRTDGDDPRVISSTASRVEDSAGNPIGTVQMDRDVTRLTHLEDRLCEQQKLADLGKMAAGLAHEVRKPLNGIKGFASLLRRSGKDEQARRKYAGRIMDAADRLNRMLARLVGFARPTGLKVRPCDLREVAEEVAEFVRFGVDDDGADVHVQVPDAAQTVLADRDKLQQILLNLVKNGVEATAARGDVVVHAGRDCVDAGRVRVRVADNGAGVPEDVAGRITEPFVTGKECGAGLGLAVVDRLLRMHDTKLRVHSERGVGTVMEFVLDSPGRTEEDDTQGAGGRR